MNLKSLKRILFPLTLLMACIICLSVIQFKPASASSVAVPCTYEADFSNGLPYDWMLYGRSDADAQVTPSVTDDGALKLGSSGGPLAEYYGTVYRFATDLGAVTDFTLEFEYKITSQRDTGRWIGLLYHTNLTNTKWLSGYSMGFRVDGRNHQTTISHNSSASSVKFSDSHANSAITPTVSWNDYHKLIVKAEGNIISHYFDSTDNLLCSYDITDPAYNDILPAQKYGGFALVINYCEIAIKSVKIEALRDPQYNAMTPGDNNTPLANYNTVGLKSQTAVISDITSAEDVNALASSGAVSSIFHLKSGTNKFYDKNGAELASPTLATLGQAVLTAHNNKTYPKYNGTYPIVYVDDAQGAETLTHYLSSHYDTTGETIQLAMMTDDASLLKSMRSTFNRVRGMLDLSATTVAKTPSAWQNVVETTHGALGTTVVLSESDATPEAVDYIHKRGITVWVKQSNYSTTSTASIMASGAGGIVSSNVSATISARSIFENDINALTRAPLNIAHRGMSMGFYPNTIEGCQASIATGATHVEIDLYVTTDNRVMVMHDDPLYVVCDCHTIGGECNDYISDMTYEQTKNFKVVKESNEFLFPATVLGAGVPIPTLDEMFAWAKTDPNALFYLELKPCDAGHGGGGTLGETYNQRLIDAIKVCIDTYDIADQVMFITSNADLATKAQEKMPGIALISTTGDNILANNNYYLDFWASINAGIDVNSGWANTPEFLALGYLPNYWTYVTEHYIREGGYPVYLDYEAAIISGVYGITNNYPFVFKNNAYRLYNDSEIVSALDLNTLFNDGATMKYITYGHQEKEVAAFLSSYEQVGNTMFATFKATFTNDYGLQYTLYTPKYEIEFTNLAEESVVTFDSNGGSAVASQTITTGETATEPVAPTKAGFTFGGWLLNGVEFDFATPVYGDITLTAKWIITVTFDANGGTLSGDASVLVQEGTTIAQPTEPMKRGHVFTGWTLNGEPFNFSTPITSSISLVATYKVFALSDFAYFTEVTDAKASISPTSASHFTSWKQILVDFGVRIPTVDKYMQDNNEGFLPFSNLGFITYTDADGNNKLSEVQFRESFLFISAINLDYKAGDILTIKAGFVFGDYQVKKDLVYICKGQDQAFQLQAQLDYTDITIRGLHVDKTSTWGWPSVQVKFTGISGVSFSQYQDCIATMIVEYKTSAGVNKPVANFIEITGSHSGETFIIRLADQGYVFQDGDTITIYKNSYVSVGDKAFRLTTDYYFVVDSTASGGYKVRTSTVTFDANGGVLTGESSVTINTGSTITAPSNPTRAETDEATYTFNGWTLNGVAYNFDSIVVDNITLKANWTINKKSYTVTYDSNGGTPVDSETKEYGLTFTRPIAPTKQATDEFTYEFAGWLLNGEAYDFNAIVVGNITLVAKWNEIPVEATVYTVTFDANGGVLTGEATLSVEENTAVAEPTAPTKQATAEFTYEFAGWTLNGEAYNFDTLVTGDITLVAKWNEIKNTYTVTFDSNGGTAVASQTVEYGLVFTEPVAPTKEATAEYTYTFNGWLLEGVVYDFDTLVTGNITLVADWTATPAEKPAIAVSSVNTVDIGYGMMVFVNFGVDGGNGYWSAMTTDLVTYTNRNGQNALATIEWCGSGFAINRQKTISIGDIVTIKAGFEWAGCEVKEDIMYQFTTSGAPWTIYDPNAQPEEPVEKTAIEIANVNYDPDTAPAAGYGRKVLVSVNFDVNSATGGWWQPIPNASEYIVITTADGTRIPTLVESCGTSIAINRMAEYVISVGDIITFKAGWVIGDYEFKEDISYKYNAEGTPFVIYDPDAQPETYTVTFDSNGGTSVDSQTVEEGLTFAEPTAPTKAATTEYTYEFAGWLLNGEAYDFDTLVTGDITLVAKWNEIKNTYTVTFDSNGGTAVDSQTVEYGLVFTDPTAPTMEATAEYTYTFAGWLLDGVAYDFTTEVTGNITLIANWTATKNSYTVTFDSNGGTAVASQTVEYGSVFTEPVAPTKSADAEYTYEFAGWLLEGVAYDFDTLVTGNITLIADWTATKNSYTVTFVVDGTDYSSETVEYGLTFTQPTAPTKDATAEYTYEFAGWLLNGEVYDFATLVTGDITLVAKWNEIPVPVEPESLTVTYTGTVIAGSTVDPNNISITLTYSDDSTEVINAIDVTYWYDGYQITDPINFVFGEELIGELEITVKYLGLETTVIIEVVAPEQPEEPDTPVVPEEPDTPVDPDQPSDPDEPTEPDTPVDPDTPPVDPEQPSDPDEPTEPDPDTPVDPDQPSDPDEPTEPDPDTPPVDPEQPGDPDEPEEPTEPEQPKGGCGSAIESILIPSIITILLAGFIVVIKKKKA